MFFRIGLGFMKRSNFSLSPKVRVTRGSCLSSTSRIFQTISKNSSSEFQIQRLQFEKFFSMILFVTAKFHLWSPTISHRRYTYYTYSSIIDTSYTDEYQIRYLLTCNTPISVSNTPFSYSIIIRSYLSALYPKVERVKFFITKTF